MLIIFDLDDTLIDSCAITKIKLKKIFFKLKKAGLNIKDEKKELSLLLNMDTKMLSAKETIKKFLEKKKSNNFLKLALKELNKNDLNIDVFPRKKANEVLKKLKEFHILAIVTIGNEKWQKNKIEKSGIDKRLFSVIEVVNEDKMVAYKKLLEKFNKKSEDTIVCGDKIEVDLKPAKLLKLKTIHMKRGRGINSKGKKFVDFQIFELEEIIKILEE